MEIQGLVQAMKQLQYLDILWSTKDEIKQFLFILQDMLTMVLSQNLQLEKR